MENRTTEHGGEVHTRMETNPSKGEGMSGRYAGASETEVLFTPEQGESRTEHARARMEDAASQAKDRAGEMASQARERAGRAIDRAESALEGSGAGSMIRDNPLAALGIAFGVGFVLAGSSGTGGQIGKAKNQLKGAVMGGLSAAVAQELRSVVGAQGSGGLGGMLGDFLGTGDSKRSTAPQL